MNKLEPSLKVICYHCGKAVEKEEEMLQYCRNRLGCYIILEKIYGHERACRILRLYDLKN